MDFTFSVYKHLLVAVQPCGYSFQTFADFIQSPKKKTIILRHDVDRLPDNALQMARLEHEAGIAATYYFRAVPESWDESIIREIASLGHEIGYHYENLSEISKKNPQISPVRSSGPTPVRSAGPTGQAGQAQINADEGKKDFLWKARMNRMIRMVGWKQLNMERGKREEEFRDKLFELAIDDFRLNLEKLRKLYPVKTICMHGSPLSEWDNKLVWEKYDYRDFGIIGEPYFDVDFKEVFYLTDTGRRWDGDRVSVRDKVYDEKVRGLEGEKFRNGNSLAQSRKGAEKRQKKFKDLRFRSTFDIIEAVEGGRFPERVMMTFHPQRWTDNPVEWMKELVWQNVKNVVKRIIIRTPEEYAPLSQVNSTGQGLRR